MSSKAQTTSPTDGKWDGIQTITPPVYHKVQMLGKAQTTSPTEGICDGIQTVTPPVCLSIGTDVIRQSPNYQSNSCEDVRHRLLLYQSVSNPLHTHVRQSPNYQSNRWYMNISDTDYHSISLSSGTDIRQIPNYQPNR